MGLARTVKVWTCLCGGHGRDARASTGFRTLAPFGDFKGFTSKRMIASIMEHPQESRREWMLWMFKRAGEKNSNVKEYQFWQQNNKPIELWSTPVIKEKFDYIHNNPVEAGLVCEPWEWKHSSARNYAELDAVIPIDEIGFLG